MKNESISRIWVCAGHAWPRKCPEVVGYSDETVLAKYGWLHLETEPPIFLLRNEEGEIAGLPVASVEAFMAVRNRKTVTGRYEEPQRYLAEQEEDFLRDGAKADFPGTTYRIRGKEKIADRSGYGLVIFNTETKKGEM